MEASHHLGPLCLAAIAGGAQGVLLAAGPDDDADLGLEQLSVLAAALAG